MNFSQLINDQKHKLSSYSYVNILWDNIHDNNTNNASNDDERKYLDHIPYAFNEFINNCIEKLRFAIQQCDEDSLKEIDNKYLITLIYYALNTDDVTGGQESVPLKAANLFILINSIQAQIFETDSVVFNKFYQKCLEVMMYQLIQSFEIDHQILIDLNKFLSLNTLNDVELLVEVLYKCVITDNTEIFKNFDYSVTTNKSLLSFYCLKTLLENSSYNENQMTRNAAITANVLMKCVDEGTLNNSSSLILCTNTRKFYQLVLNPYLKCDWFMNLFKYFTKIYYNNQKFLDFINELCHKFYINYVKMISKEMLSSGDSCKLQIMAFNILQTFSSNIDYSKRKYLSNLVIHNLILLFGHEHPEFKETSLEIFEKLLHSRDPLVADPIQIIVLSDPLTEKINISSIFEVLKQSADVKWKRKKFNKGFVNVTCLLFIKNNHYINEDRIDFLERLCLKAPSVEFKQCTPVLLKLLRQYVLMYSRVTTFVLNVLIHHSCCPTATTANFYVKELFEIIAEAVNVQHPNDIAFEIVDVLISSNYNYSELFKKFHGLDLLRTNIVRNLLDKIVLNQPRAWKLLASILEYLDYHTFPNFIDHYFELVIEQHFFTLHHCGDMLNVFNKIVKCIINCNTKKQHDMIFMSNLENYLIESVQNRNVPIQYIGLVLQLLNNLKQNAQNSNEWFNELFTELDELLHKILLDVKLAENHEREVAYIGEILILYDYHLSDRNKNGLKELFQKHDILLGIPNIWSFMIVLYGKMCVKELDYVDDCIKALEFSLKNGTGYIQHCCIGILYDLCNVHLHYFDPLFPYLFILLRSEDAFIRYTTGKLVLKLNSEDHLRFKYIHLVSFVTLLADPILKISNYFQDVLKVTFLKKNEQVIVKHFLQIVMHFNNYLSHACFTFFTDNIDDLNLGDYNKDRRNLIYKYLLLDLSKYNQLQLLHQITKELLIPVLNEAILLNEVIINALDDLMFIIGCMCNEEEKDFYECQMKLLSKDLGKKSHNFDVTSTKYEDNKIIIKLICTLTQLCQKLSNNSTNRHLIQKMFHAALLISRTFYNNILTSLKEDGNQTKRTLISLNDFYNTNKSYLSYNNIN